MMKLLRGALCLASVCASTPLAAQAPAPALAFPYVPDSPDVLHYGTSTGQTPNPGSRTQIFGSPVPGQTIGLQVVGARPNVSATFYVSAYHDDQNVPGVGRVLVDLNSALTVDTITDAQGRAHVSVPIPANTPEGAEYFVQCATADSGQPSQLELSSAAYFQVGGASKPVGALSLLFGTITVHDDGTSTSSTVLSGAHALEWNVAGAGQIAGTLAVHTATSSITVNGQLIEELRVQPGESSTTLTWQSSDFLEVPGMFDDFLVSYEFAGTEYGPYTVSGVLTSVRGDVKAWLDPLPFDGGPLDGARIDLDMDETFVEPDYFDAIENTGLPEDANSPDGVTPADVDARFAMTAQLIADVLASYDLDVGFFDPSMPGYEQFVEDEAEILLELTDGRASTAAQVQELIELGELSLGDGWGSIIASKLLAALGIKEGAQGFTEVFLDVCGDLLEELGKQIDAGEYGKAAKTLGKILDKVLSKDFAKKLADKIGTKLAGKILAKVGSKFIPIVGWAWFAASLLWAIIEQWF